MAACCYTAANPCEDGDLGESDAMIMQHGSLRALCDELITKKQSVKEIYDAAVQENEKLKTQLQDLQRSSKHVKVNATEDVKLVVRDQPEKEESCPKKARSHVSVFRKEEAEADLDDEEELEHGVSSFRGRGADSQESKAVIIRTLVLKGLIYLLGLGGVIFVLVAHSYQLGASKEDVAGCYRPGKPSELLLNIAYCLVGCGLITFFVNIAKQPLILGYLLGGVLVGPKIGLSLVPSHESISELSSMGLIFLLFMIGLELDVTALLKLGKVVMLTGLFQFPLCAGIHVGIFMGLHHAGLSWGVGDFAAMYVGIVCGISSTMIVVKLLSSMGETDRPHGRLTIGILIFQDIWAIVVLAIQPNLDKPEILPILFTFVKIFLLIVCAMLYAKFVMPAILHYSSKSVELMFVLSLAWCFFICMAAILPFVGLSMELASLIAGGALAAFPYSAEFNGKIKFIRDFFITLFFAALGMQIPVPAADAIGKALVIAAVVLLIRWIGIFSMVYILGGGAQLGAMATINLSQVSEFALVICSLGQGFGHVEGDTMTIIIWTFAILAISASYLIGYNADFVAWVQKKIKQWRKKSDDSELSRSVSDLEHEHRDILLLGFYRIANMLISEFEHKEPELLHRIHVVDSNEEMKEMLESKGVEFQYGDITSPDVLEHAYHGEPSIILATVPDTALVGTTNEEILRVMKEVWPTAKTIVTADNPAQAARLYSQGASYVLRSAKLCAERLQKLLADYDTGNSELYDMFKKYKNLDAGLRAAKSKSTVT
eukprot:TRINITY_DN18507_c0_g1_i1.p1 TRINITY_DN18507_c0_g1~~TRINITY_DN18507_c0_g1_i1.p1  ORF type:complete len:772 (+),score=154.65 TRINITY_DN18507_c0_g1_i1:72-2387(+)